MTDTDIATTEQHSPRKIGRPREYDNSTADEIIQRMTEGESVRSICRDSHMPDRATVVYWLTTREAFSSQYAKAREALADHYFDEVIELADQATPETERVQRLRCDKRQWACARMAPWKYGEKTQVDHISSDGSHNEGDERQLARAILAIFGKNFKEITGEVNPRDEQAGLADVVEGTLAQSADG